MKTTFIPLDYQTFDYEERNYIQVFGRDEKGKKICIIDTCPIYLWAILKEKLNKNQVNNLIESIKQISLDEKGRKTKVEKIEIHEKKFLGKKVEALKIFATNYKDLHDLADKLDFEEIDKRRGYDLGFITHYIIERKLNPLQWYEIEGEMLHNSDKFGGIDSNLQLDFCIELKSLKKLAEEKKRFTPKIIAYDIEAKELELGKGEILMISLYGENFKKVLTWKDSSKKSFVEKFKDEKEMIEAFTKNIQELSPDILTGYFSDGFDLPYIKARAEKLKIRLNLGIDNSQPVFSRGIFLTGKIKGIVHIDLLRFIRNAYSQYMQSETLSLNEVSNELLGEGKIELSPLEESKKSKVDWEKFYEYNLKDSELTYKLFEKVWPDMEEITSITKEPLFNVSRTTMASSFEDYIIHNLDRFNEIPEKKPYNPEISERRNREKYQGAFVFQPKPGLYENIAFFDFSSSYGSVIVSYNLSKSTHTEDKKNSYVGEYQKEKVYFSKEPGFIPELLKEIIMKRRKFKEDYNKNPTPILKARSNAFKLIANAAYGYQGFFGARYYSIEAASSTAYFARENIQKAINIFEKEGFEPVYSDTDSIAVILGKKTKKQVLELLNKINKDLPGIMELDLEGFFKRGLWVTKRTGDFGAKKKYALIDEDGKIKIRGFETVRRDWCDLAREVQNRVIKLVLEKGNEKEAMDYVKEIVKKLKERKIDKEELIIRTQLKKSISEYKAISPHVIAAKKMREHSIAVDEGNLIEYYIAETNDKNCKLVREKVKLPNEEGEYNIEYYLDRQILPAVENIFQVFNVDVKDLINKKNQKKLSDF
ncbi:MAG: DNA polymerase domain-containing protein [Nanobdellota archaeon]